MAVKKSARKGIVCLLIIMCFGMLCSCAKEVPIATASSETEESEKETAAPLEKGYNLPVSDEEKAEAERECQAVMEIMKEIYIKADKGDAVNVVISDETILQMVEIAGEKGYSVIGSGIYSNMRNYETVEAFLETVADGKSATATIYEISSDGGAERQKYIYDGTDMYVISAKYSWNDKNDAQLTYMSNTRIKEWRYSEKGWFGYELCVPEYPEVTEMVDGSCLIRIKPITKVNREYSEKYVQVPGYQGNNLLCSNWNAEQLEKLDYNGMYEYLYQMKYNKRLYSEDYPNGIPKEEFENLITEYIPVTAEQVREYAVFDEKCQTYAWVRLGCLNYAPTSFGTAFPEVTNVKENGDGTITLTIDAVCEMCLCDEDVITHELVIRNEGDGSFQYLGNKILDDGMERIPDYQYRIRAASSCRRTWLAFWLGKWKASPKGGKRQNIPNRF